MANKSNSVKIAEVFIKDAEKLASASPYGVVLVKPDAPDNTKIYAHWDNLGKVWTIGWGNTYRPDGSKVAQSDVITKKQADSWINNTINEQANGVAKSVDTSKLTDNQFAALISIAYNAGIGNFNKSNIPAAINSGKTPQQVAAVISDSLITSKGVRVQGLVNRRSRESKLYLSGNSGVSVAGGASGKTGLITGIVLVAAAISIMLYKKLN